MIVESYEKLKKKQYQNLKELSQVRKILNNDYMSSVLLELKKNPNFQIQDRKYTLDLEKLFDIPATPQQQLTGIYKNHFFNLNSILYFNKKEAEQKSYIGDSGFSDTYINHPIDNGYGFYGLLLEIEGSFQNEFTLFNKNLFQSTYFLKRKKWIHIINGIVTLIPLILFLLKIINIIFCLLFSIIGIILAEILIKKQYFIKNFYNNTICKNTYFDYSNKDLSHLQNNPYFHEFLAKYKDNIELRVEQNKIYILIKLEYIEKTESRNKTFQKMEKNIQLFNTLPQDIEKLVSHLERNFEISSTSNDD